MTDRLQLLYPHLHTRAIMFQAFVELLKHGAQTVVALSWSCQCTERLQAYVQMRPLSNFLPSAGQQMACSLAYDLGRSCGGMALRDTIHLFCALGLLHADCR